MKRNLLVLFILAWLAACSSVPSDRTPAAANPGTVVFMSDFGVLDDAVAICKGVMLEYFPGLRLVDASHQITPFSIADAARYLANMAPYFPPGTVFVTVVDPGVGTDRKNIVVKAKNGHYYVQPDNGLLTFVQDQYGIEEVREITNPRWIRAGKTSNTFHGKDVFSPAGALLAKGESFADVGPVLKQWVRLPVMAPVAGPNQTAGQVIALDGPYGNVITNIMGTHLTQLGYQLGDNVPVKIGKRTVPLRFSRVFGDVPVGKPLMYLDWHDRVCFAVNQGNFATAYKVKPPTVVTVPRK